MFTKSIAIIVTAILLMHLPSARPSAANVEDLTRIVGGKPTTIESVPYLVQIWKGEDFMCGGSLVAESIVVTAAHCLIGSKANEFTVVGGASSLSDAGGERRNVSKIIKPETFTTSNMKMDVAVMKLDAAMTGDNISTIELNSEPLVRGQVMHVSGWGLKSEYANNPPNQVHHMFVPVIARPQCEADYKNILPIAMTMFCAAKPGVKDHCFGDSGGPAVCNGKLCGIVSLAVGCARRNYPGVYTGVRAVLPFINKAMQKLA